MFEALSSPRLGGLVLDAIACETKVESNVGKWRSLRLENLKAGARVWSSKEVVRKSDLYREKKRGFVPRTALTF
jgi:hypothetical protein